LQVGVHNGDWPPAVHPHNPVFRLHQFELLGNPLLVEHEGLEEVVREPHVGTRLVVVQGTVLLEDPVKELLGRDVEVEYEVRFDGEPEQVVGPGPAHASDIAPRHQGVDVPVREDDVSCVEGGDDFVFICDDDKADTISQNIIDAFDKLSPGFYNDEDRAAGFIMGIDRKGNAVKAGLVSVSIGIVSNVSQKITHVAQIGEIGAELKKYAKSMDKSNFQRDQRKPK
jgi:hypothetical protein